jgi:mono/diheme cytochrome c family protein
VAVGLSLLTISAVRSFKGQLSEAQIEAVADYVSQNAGK